MSDLVQDLKARGNTFINAAKKDAELVMLMMFQLTVAVRKNEPLEYTIKDGSTSDCKEIHIIDIHNIVPGSPLPEPSICVLSVLNYYTFPVTAMLDSITLSQKGKLDDALDIRPFMFSGPAPTMVIWSGSDQESIPVLGYPKLTNEDAKQAFSYWLRYIFGVNLSDEDKLS